EIGFRATEGENGPVILDLLVWELFDKDGTSLATTSSSAKLMTVDLLPGGYSIEVLRPEDEAIAKTGFTVADNSMTVTLVLPVFVPPASLNAPDTAVAGSNINIEWDGPNAKNDYITVSEIGSSGNQYIAFQYTHRGTPASLKMPLHPGEYQLRYVLAQGHEIIARRKIMITPVTATLAPPAPITAGSTFTLEWSGPDYKKDYISLAKPGSAVNQYDTFEYTHNGSPMRLRAPTTPGKYMLRYIAAGPDKMAIATQEVEIVAVSATLETKDIVPAGGKLQVTWTGPDGDRDYISIAEVGSRVQDELSYTYTKDSTGDSLTIKVPTTPGTYELRYVQNGNPKATLASKTLVVEPVTATLASNDTVAAGGRVVVTWTGPNNDNDYIALAEVGSRVQDEVAYVYLRQGDGQSLAIDMPTTPGTYELRYIQNGSPKMQLAMKPLTITAVTASLEAKDTVPSGGKILVNWTGPNGKNDYIAIAEIGSRVQDKVTYSYLRQGDGQALLVKVPGAPGSYELRYIQNGNPKTMLASRPLTVQAVEATLTAKGTAAPGANLVVEWTGPAYKNDRIVISRVGDKGYESYTYIREGSPLIITVPDAPGDYELMYIIAQDSHVLTRQPLSVK
ncbi:MAG: hypothetical protein KAT26_01910, partial [Marinosulfonomonas sp.]|nr:hypothetical protein [Marinosulfonomonas sp.]